MSWFNNQPPADEPPAQSTASMWLRMLGLEGLWETAQSPGFQQQISALVNAIVETRQCVARMEYKIDLLLDAAAYDGERTIAQFLADRRTVGTGAITPASAFAHARDGTDQDRAGGSGEVARDAGSGLPSGSGRGPGK